MEDGVGAEVLDPLLYSVIDRMVVPSVSSIEFDLLTVIVPIQMPVVLTGFNPSVIGTS